MSKNIDVSGIQIAGEMDLPLKRAKTPVCEEALDMDKEFVRCAMSIRRLWIAVKEICDQNEHLKGDFIRTNFVQRLTAEYFSQFTEHFIRLNGISAVFDDQTFEDHKKFLREQLCPLMINEHTPLNKQIHDKPFGYAGDFVVANYFYELGYSGTSLWGMMMDRYTAESPLATAHRNRRGYLGGFIAKLAARKKGEEVQIASFACGPAPEAFDTLDRNITNVHFTLLDGEPMVLKFLREKRMLRKKSEDRIHVMLANIINLLRKNESLTIPSQDLVYCAGFFDYIRPGTATKCIRYMMRHLKPGGWLVIVNVSMHDVRDVCLKMLADWDLYHRSKQDLLDIVEGVEGVAYKKVWADFQTKRNLYLILRKA